MFTKAQSQKLIAKAEARLAVFREVHNELRRLFDAAEDIHNRPLDDFSPGARLSKFALENEHCCDYWRGIRDAMEGLYQAQCALNNLANIEQRKIAKIERNTDALLDLESYGYMTDDWSYLDDMLDDTEAFCN